MLYLTTHSTHFIYGYMAIALWNRPLLLTYHGHECHDVVLQVVAVVIPHGAVGHDQRLHESLVRRRPLPPLVENGIFDITRRMSSI